MINKLNKIFESRVRLTIMSKLMVEDKAEFNQLKQEYGLTDGNLASHTMALEKAKYLTVKKEFVGRKTRTTFVLTAAGRKAFQNHLNALEELIRGV